MVNMKKKVYVEQGEQENLRRFRGMRNITVPIEKKTTLMAIVHQVNAYTER